MSRDLIRDVLEDLTENVNALHEVLVPDWLDQLETLDWDSLDQLQHISKTIHKTVMQVCDHYRWLAHRNSRLARNGMNGAPPGSVTPPWPGS